jgi:hypothetical protein
MILKKNYTSFLQRLTWSNITERVEHSIWNSINSAYWNLLIRVVDNGTTQEAIQNLSPTAALENLSPLSCSNNKNAGEVHWEQRRATVALLKSTQRSTL